VTFSVSPDGAGRFYRKTKIFHGAPIILWNQCNGPAAGIPASFRGIGTVLAYILLTKLIPFVIQKEGER
jgi:hypothetical protein